MKFLTIDIENIFAYCGPQHLDVSGTTPDKNVILIWGRNGMGKTSLLNAIKLLFVGAEDGDIRTIGFPPHKLPHRQFVLGDGANWSGVINRRALARDPEARAKVRIVWQEQDGRRVIAERQWAPTTGGYRESIVVTDGEHRLTQEAAEDRISDFLPRDFVPFFFFDGEHIKSLAEAAEGRKQLDFDRVLRISFITELAKELAELATQRQRMSLTAEVRDRIAAVEAEIQVARVTQETATQRISDLDDQILQLVDERRRLERRRENLRSGASDADRAALEARREELSNQFQEQSLQIAEEIPPYSPMVANLGLVSAALAALEERLSGAAASEQLVIYKIKEKLPEWIHEGPPALADDDANTLVETLHGRIDAFIQVPVPSGLFSGIDISRALNLRDSLARMLASSAEKRRRHSEMLSAARRTRIELEKTTEDLMQLEVGSQATLDEYKSLTEQLAGVHEQIAEFNQLKGQQQQRLDEAQKVQRAGEARLRELEREQVQVKQDSADARCIQQLARSFTELREELRRTLREKAESIINEKYQMLVQGYHLVESLHLDDTYTLNYLDDRGGKIGRASLSSGIKQLAATALLWAMKEIPGHQVPIAIDTPLGRIDKENQDNMLLNCYPYLSHQVLIFPTNAEIDTRKFGLLESRVARQFRIVNDTGEDASIHPGSLLA